MAGPDDDLPTTDQWLSIDPEATVRAAEGLQAVQEDLWSTRESTEVCIPGEAFGLTEGSADLAGRYRTWREVFDQCVQDHHDDAGSLHETIVDSAARYAETDNQGAALLSSVAVAPDSLDSPPSATAST